MRLFFCALSWMFAGLSANASEQTATMPLSEVKPGMEGVWKTVVQGTEVATFRLKVIGVAENFAGPRQPVIIAEALDPSQMLSGPVSGMSGSPVYIEGRLVGAYAYGYSWQKEQAIIGITPIESMYAVLDLKSPGPDNLYPNSGHKKGSGSGTGWSPRFLNLFADNAHLSGTNASAPDVSLPAFGHWGHSKPSAASVHDSLPGPELKPVPTPLFSAGVSAATLAAFGDHFRALGLDIMQAPLGSSKAMDSVELKPGSAVAAVLMTGDFSFARVGTVTWREGDQLLAFGHAMDSAGAVRLPLAPAEVITVVQNVQTSFKLSNFGATVGTIYQDRLSGIAARIGELPPVTPMVIEVHQPGGELATYRCEMAIDRRLTPLLAGISLLESLSSTLDADTEQTFFVDIKVKMDQQEDLHLRDVGSGQGAALSLARGFMAVYDALLNNPFEVAKVVEVEVKVDIRSGQRLSQLRAVEQLSGELRSGDELRFAVEFEHFQSPNTRKIIAVPLPVQSEVQNLQLLVADAAVTESYDIGILQTGTIQSLPGLIEYLNRKRSSERLYVKLLKPSNGMRIHDQHFYDLPPSVRKLMQSPRLAQSGQQVISWQTLWETSIDLGSQVSGSYQFPVSLN